MSNKKREIEARGADVDAAIESGLNQLGLKRNDVIIEIVDEGSRGLLGLGSRDAVVRLTAMVSPKPTPAPTKAPKKKAEPKPKQETAVSPPPKPEAPPKQETAVTEETKVEPEKEAVTESEARAEERELALGLLKELLDKMQVEAEVSAHLSEPDDLTGDRITVLDVRGEDLGVLIGSRGETLNSLQYILRLMVGHKLRRRTTFVIDVEGYRERREQALTRLAQRMAKKVANRNKPISLEPMSPYERRIIHVALRNDDRVYTQSSGEGKRRKVRIYPQK